MSLVTDVFQCVDQTYCRKNGDRRFTNVNTGENRGSLRDTWKTLVKNLWRKVRKLEVDVVLVWTNTTALTDLHGHRTGDNITRSKILGGWCVTLHEALTLRVEKVSTLTTGSLGDQTSGTVDTSWVELNKLHILVRKTGTGDHGHTVTGTGVGRSAREVRATVSTSGENSVVCAEPVKSTVLLVVSHDTLALAVLHDQISSEVLDEVVGVVAERLTVESVKKSVSSSVSSSATPVGLATLAVVLGLTTESSLVAGV